MCGIEQFHLFFFLNEWINRNSVITEWAQKIYISVSLEYILYHAGSFFFFKSLHLNGEGGSTTS